MSMSPMLKTDDFKWITGVPGHKACSLSMQTAAPLNELQRAIGQYLRLQYDLTQAVPNRLVALLRKAEPPA
jgi:hypothetical protein